MLSALHALTFMCRSERENVDEDILAMGKGAHKVLVDLQPQCRRFDRACRWRLISCNRSISTRSRLVPPPYQWPSLHPPLTRHPQAVHSTPLNHIGLWVDNLPLAVQWLTSQAPTPLRRVPFLRDSHCSCRACDLLPAVFVKARLVMTSRSCIRRAVLMRPSAARECL